LMRKGQVFSTSLQTDWHDLTVTVSLDSECLK
jgi:hypothetical protein